MMDQSRLHYTLKEWVLHLVKRSPKYISQCVLTLVVSAWHNQRRIVQLRRIAQANNCRLHLILLRRSMGDLIAAEPALRLLRQKDEYVVWLCFPGFFDVLRHNKNIDLVVGLTSYTEGMVLRYLNWRGRWTNLELDGGLCETFGFRVYNKNVSGLDVTNYYSNHNTLADVYTLIAGGRRPAERPRLYLNPEFDADALLCQQFGSPCPPILVFHPRASEDFKSWPSEKADAFVRWLLSATNYAIVEVGIPPFLAEDKRVYVPGKALDLNAHMALAARADLFVGVDSGFSHAAQAAGRSCIMLIGAYRQFLDHTPWAVSEQDIIIRCSTQATEIPVADVKAAVIQHLRSKGELIAARSLSE